MLAERRLRKILSDLNRGVGSTFEIEGQQLTFSWVDNSSVLTIKTPVYYGENYIPASVRSSLPSGKNRGRFFSIDEGLFEIDMLSEVDTSSMTDREFDGVLTEFCSDAEMWRSRLDGKDRNDLLYVRVPK